MLNDPTDPSNPINGFIDDYQNIADVCQPFYTLSSLIGQDQTKLTKLANIPIEGSTTGAHWLPEGSQATVFDRGCTKLETFSANLERFLVTLEIVGQDDYFDPPETVAEIIAMLDGDFSTDIFGDPISGPDGIYTRNTRVFTPDDSDVHAVVMLNNQRRITIDDVLDGFDNEVNTADEFWADYRHSDCGTGLVECRLEVGERGGVTLAATQALVSALPLRQVATLMETPRDAAEGFFELVDGFDVNRNGVLDKGDSVFISPLFLSNADDGDGDGQGRMEGQILLGELFAGRTAVVDSLSFAKTSTGEIVRLDSLAVRLSDSTRRATFGNLDINSNLVRDLDEDQAKGLDRSERHAGKVDGNPRSDEDTLVHLRTRKLVYVSLSASPLIPVRQ